MKSIFSNNFDEGTWAGGGLDTIHDQLDTSRLATFSFTDDQGSPVYQDMIVSSITIFSQLCHRGFTHWYNHTGLCSASERL